MRKKLLEGKKHGFGLIVILGFAAVLTVFTSAIAAQAAFNLRTVEQQSEKDLAYYGAYSGVQSALAMLKDPPPYLYTDDDGNEGAWLEVDRKVRLGLGRGVDAGARVYHNIEGFPGAVGAPGVDPDELPPDGTEVALNHFYIVAVGEVNFGEVGTGVRFEATTMGATIASDFPTMPHAAFGYEQVVIDGLVDHFNSDDEPPYNPVPAPNPDPEASVGTNSTVPQTTQSDTAAGVVLGENGGIDGNVYFGQGTDVTDFVEFLRDERGMSPPPHALASMPIFARTRFEEAGDTTVSTYTEVSGNVTTLSRNRATLDVQTPEDFTHLNGSITGTQTLVGGRTYLVSGNLEIGGSGDLRVDPDSDGDAVVFVDGNVTVQPGATAINANQPPRRLKIFSLAPDASFTMTGRHGFFLVAGNDLDITIGTGAELWGAALGQTVTMEQNSRLHYDVMLRDPTRIADTYDYQVTGSAATGGAIVTPDMLAPIGAEEPGPLPGGDPPPPYTPPPPGGCGCGGGSQYIMMKH